MNDEWVDDDGLLLQALGDALRERDTTPEWFTAAGKACFAWHDVDAELARLSNDSALLAVSSATRAEQAEVRALTFEARDLTIEVELTRHSLRGQLVPPQTGQLVLELEDGESLRTIADDLGFFVFARAPGTSFRLRCTTASTFVSTSWVTL